ncbi:MAG: isoamylase early set domain-containing protein [bacterium]
MKKKTARTKPAKRNMTFSYTVKPDAKEVFLVGDFNNWNQRTDRMVKRRGAFQKSKQLVPGEYQYKFLVDGEWYPDPAAERQIPNKYGTLNSVIRVEEAKNE